MKTKTELMALTSMQLRKVASELKVKDYGTMDKSTLVTACLGAQASPISDEEVIYTDRHENELTNNGRVNVRVGSKWFGGIITSFKVIDNEQYVHVLVDGADKTKLFHTMDVETEKSAIKPVKPAEPSVVAEEIHKLTPTVVETSKEPEPAADKPVVVPASAPKTVVKSKGTPTTPVTTEVYANGFKKTKYDAELCGVDTKGVNCMDMVSFTVNLNSKINPGKVMTGVAKSLVYDPVAKKPYFIVKLEGDKKDYFKTIDSVTKVNP